MEWSGHGYHYHRFCLCTLAVCARTHNRQQLNSFASFAVHSSCVFHALSLFQFLFPTFNSFGFRRWGWSERCCVAFNEKILTRWYNSIK